MDRFKYNGKIYETWNLKKELKKLGIKKDDIEILPSEEKPKQQEEKEFIRGIYRWDPNKNTFHVGYTRDISKKPLDGEEYIEALKKPIHVYSSTYTLIWDPIKKTGYGSYFTEEYARTLVLLKGKPKFPVEIGEDGLPILEEVYTDWYPELKK